MPEPTHGAPNLPESVLGKLSSWLCEMEDEGLLDLKLTPGKLTVTSPSGAVVTIERVDTRYDITRVLLGTPFSLRIEQTDGEWYIVDRHGRRQLLEAEAFYGELRELLSPPGPSL